MPSSNSSTRFNNKISPVEPQTLDKNSPTDDRTDISSSAQSQDNNQQPTASNIIIDPFVRCCK